MAKFTERMIEDCRHRFEAGDKTALLDAVDLCARSGLALPVWLAEAYSAGYTAWATYKVRSLTRRSAWSGKADETPTCKSARH